MHGVYRANIGALDRRERVPGSEVGCRILDRNGEPMQTVTNTQTNGSILRAFHGDPKIKAKYLARIRAHVKADELIRGTGWDESSGRGCAVGCTLNAYDHQAYETELGIPEALAYLEDSIFENLPVEEAMKWPGRFLKAIPVDADLSKIIAQLVIWQFEDETYGLKNTEEVKQNAKLREVCEDLVVLYRCALNGETVTDREWEDIYQRAGAWAGAGARAGARARAWAWAGARAWAPEYSILANKLVELLESAPCK